MPISNDWIKRKKNNKNKNIILLFLLILILSYGTNEVLKSFGNKENNTISEKENIQKNIKDDIKSNENILNEEQKKKSFKIKYEVIEGVGGIDFNYNINMIINNLEKVKSNLNDNNYEIEIIGYISKYGNLFYNISKRKNNNIYDKDFMNILNELKKYTFKYQDETVNFKIYINNNSMNLN